MTNPTIPCPGESCSGKITLETQALLRGAKFVCPVCSTAVSLANDGKQQVDEALQKFEDLKMSR